MSLKSGNVISFYEAKEVPYGAFSNYSISPLIVDEKKYNSVEHFYQSQKFSGVSSELQEKIRLASTPHQSKILASLRVAGGYAWREALNDTIQTFLDQGVQLRKDWEDVKEDVMYKGLYAKFTQNRLLEKLLLFTENKQIEENSPRDWYWGVGKDHTGKNRLGVLLMKIRDDLRQAKKRKREEEKEEESSEGKKACLDSEEKK
jgi:ribA/ribD-fused uncharacterized protein